MTPRYQWTPASEPPDSDRDVLVWQSQGIWSQLHIARYFSRPGFWTQANVAYWRDVEEPPTEGKG